MFGFQLRGKFNCTCNTQNFQNFIKFSMGEWHDYSKPGIGCARTLYPADSILQHGTEAIRKFQNKLWWNLKNYLHFGSYYQIGVWQITLFMIWGDIEVSQLHSELCRLKMSCFYQRFFSPRAGSFGFRPIKCRKESEDVGSRNLVVAWFFVVIYLSCCVLGDDKCFCEVRSYKNWK